MDTVRRQLPDTNGTRLTVQFAFTDVEPWVLRLGGGGGPDASSAAATRSADVHAAHELGRLARRRRRPREPGHAVMRGKLRPRARLSALKLLPAALGGHRH